MKKIKITLPILFTVLTISFSYCLQNSDGIFEGDVTLTSQAEVDAFPYTEVTGILTISGNDILNLDALDGLTRVGSLTISGNGSLMNLIGLSALNQVGAESGGFFPYSSAVIISDNPLLKNLDGLSISTAMIGPIWIRNNPLLETINAFSSLTTILGALEITGNDALISFSGISKVKSVIPRPPIRPTVIIDNNASLPNLDGLSSLETIQGNGALLQISNNESLNDVTGLASLTTISGGGRPVGLSIHNNDALTNIDGLSSFSNFQYGVLGTLVISDNAMLDNIDGLSNLAVGLTGELYISVTKNASLTRCSGLFPTLVNLGWETVLRLSQLGNLAISENGSGCTLEDIVASGPQSIPNFSMVDNLTGGTLASFTDSITLDLAHLDFSNLVLQANTFPQPVGSVEFIFDKQNPYTTNVHPYTIPLPDGLVAGTYTVNANVYSESDKQGTQGIGKSVIITVINTSLTECPGSNLVGDPDATAVRLHWTPYTGPETVMEYLVKRDGERIGSTVGKHGYFTDFGLSPDSTYSYTVDVMGINHNVICRYNTTTVKTTSQTTIKTRYKLLAIVFNPTGELDSELNHIRTFLNYRVDFLKYASQNSVNMDLYKDDIVTINTFPPLVANSTSINYTQLALTNFPELDNNTMVDLIEKYDIDIVWVLGAPTGYDFAENVLMGNRDLGNQTWVSTKVKCSRSFFIHSNSGDARAFDAAAHHVEGTMTSATEGSPENWPRDKEFLVYRGDRSDFSVYSTKLHLWGRFRLTDEWNGRYSVEGHLSNAYASKGNASCGSSHFVPGSIRSSSETSYDDYTYYDVKAWQRYVDCFADDWLTYPNFSDESRKINGYDFGAFNNYQENGSTHSFGFGTASFHQWWFNHVPHNPGVSDGKLNNWWPYIYDCNRFDGSEIQYAVGGFPEVLLTYVTTNEEYGTEETGNDNNWMFWHTNTDFGQRADLSIVDKSQNPEYVKNGQSSTKVEVQVESFSSNGRNDLIYPRYRNAHWNFSLADSITISVKFPSQQLVRGTNPIIRFCKNGNNRIEFIPKKEGLYTNLFNDNTLPVNNGWYTFNIPVSGNASWERNIIGYIDPELELSDQEQARQEIIKNILEDVNYFEISIQSDGGRGESLVYYVDNLKVHIRDTTEVPLSILSFSLINKKTLTEIQSFQDSITLDIANLPLANLSIQANTIPEQVGSVEFIFDKKFTHVQNRFPYRFALPFHIDVGTHTISVNAYSEPRKQGVKGVEKSAVITVINSAAVVGFDVVDIFGKLIVPLNEGDEINISSQQFKFFSIRANTWPQPVSFIKFWLNGRFYRQDNFAPYSLNGDAYGFYVPWKARPGYYTLEAVPYTKRGHKAYAGKSLKIRFKIVEEECLMEVISFDVVDTSGKLLMRLRDGDKINIEDSRFKAFNIVANTTGPVGSVNFQLNNRSYRTENAVPYALAGDQKGKFNSWTPELCDYKLSAIPHAQKNSQGPTGKSLTIHFRVVREKIGTIDNLVSSSTEESLLQQGEVSGIVVYPVPADDELHVQIEDLAGNGAIITIVNIQGHSVYRGSFAPLQFRENSINTTRFQPGVYYLQVSGNNGFRRMVKFIKK